MLDQEWRQVGGLRAIRGAVNAVVLKPVAMAAIIWLVSIGGAMAASNSLNDGWRFIRGDVPGAEAIGFDDSAWRTVAVPHDWSIEDLPGQQHPFDASSVSKHAQGYTLGGIGWYRRKISLPADLTTKTILLRFESVYMDAQVWVNGELLARRSHGYTEFIVEMDKVARPGENVVALRVENPGLSSRWYSGSGIIRPVHLEVLDRIHIDPWSPAITTPEVSTARAQVHAATKVANRSESIAQARLITRLVGSDGKEVERKEESTAIGAGSVAELVQVFDVRKPALWSPEAPNLYTLVQDVHVNGRLADSRHTRLGIRSISFDAKHGFLLNGKRVLLKGGNVHHDNYMLGAAGIARADARKVELMRAAGYNAIRSAHNPPSRALLDAADRLGMLVISEAFDMWSMRKNKNDYSRFFKTQWRSDLEAMIQAARNHPSVIMWSIGNEIPNMHADAGATEAKQIADAVRALDPTRPTTVAAHLFISKQGADAFLAAVDVAGYNYYPENYSGDHERFPARIMYGSESFSAQAFEYWAPTATMPWVIGDFVWSAIDYLGEAGIGWTTDSPHPWHLAMTGEIDATGQLRPAAYYRQVLWNTGLNATSAFVEWPLVEGSLPNRMTRGPASRWEQPDLVQSWEPIGAKADYFPIRVVVFSENEAVELFVNGVSQGRKPVSRDTQYKTDFWVRFQRGELKAVGFKKGKPQSQWVLKTADKPAAIRLSVDRARIAADGDDLAYVTAELIDADGSRVTRRNEDKPLTFKVAGPATLAGVGNGDPVALESFQSGRRSTFHGRAVGVVRAGKLPGLISVEVTSPDLPSASASIVVEEKLE